MIIRLLIARLAYYSVLAASGGLFALAVCWLVICVSAAFTKG